MPDQDLQSNIDRLRAAPATLPVLSYMYHTVPSDGIVAQEMMHVCNGLTVLQRVTHCAEKVIKFSSLIRISFRHRCDLDIMTFANN